MPSRDVADNLGVSIPVPYLWISLANLFITSGMPEYKEHVGYVISHLRLNCNL